MNFRDVDVLTLARTLYGEARGESRIGQIAVAWVIRNRLENYPGAWWSQQVGDGIPDSTIEAVCLERNQFSCWWDSQAKKVRSRTPSQLGDLMVIAQQVLEGNLTDPTDGATHYHTCLRPEWAKSWPPKWAHGRVGKTVGSHIFYKIGPG